MNRPELIRQIIRLYTASQNAKSKWFAQDLADFKLAISLRTDKELKQQLANLNALAGNDSRFNRICDKEEKRMQRAGMYDLGNMKPKNALD